jgi:acyl-CoA synthetase (NDP forming)/GNAT superfamily N-acetyltransferase
MTIEIRPATPGDRTRVNLSKLSPERVCRASGPDHRALLALKGDDLVGVGTYEINPEGTAAEIAFSVADGMHGRGVGTLLLEHLVSDACGRGVHTFTGPVLAENSEMLKVFADAGLSARRQTADGVIEFTCHLTETEADPGWEPYLEAVDERESHADVASLRHVFQPDSVAVVGAGRRPGTLGRAILHNIVTGGYQGRVYAINPHATRMEGVRCLPTVTNLPEPVDLAVVAVPPPAVPTVADECGRRKVKALAVVTMGLDALQGADLLATCRRYGMRLIGPNCGGIAVPGIGLNATFAARQPAPGPVGLVMQSGGLGFAVIDRLSRLGLGVSSFASVGNKYDVSGNDLLMWWAEDHATRLAVLYLESLGNPRKFARAARRLGRRMPVLAVEAGRSAGGQQAATAHTAAVATPLVAREALFDQAGIIPVESLGELLDTAALLASQPLPAGRNVAVISNVGGAAVLAADACARYGLSVHQFSSEIRRRLAHGLLAPGAAVKGPVNTTAAISETSFRICLELIAADQGVDAVLVLVLPTAATGDLVTAVRAADVRVPVAAVLLNQTESIRLLPRATEGGLTGAAARPSFIPAYSDPEPAAHALARAASYGVWRSRPAGHLPELPGHAENRARDLVRAYLAGSPQGGWLPPVEAARLLRCYHVPVTAPGPRRAESSEVRIGVIQEPVFGPLVTLEPGGATADVLADQAVRLTPLTDTDADELIESSSAAPLLRGHHGVQPADLAAVRDVLLRVSRLADDLPEITELDLSPVMARPDGVSVTAARIRLAQAEPHDSFLRRLR